MKRSDVVIRTPCGADWDRMDPRGSARFCGQCDKLVHDLSSMTELEARRLLRVTPESLCVRYLYDASGTIWFEGDRRLVASSRLNRAKRSLMAASLMAATPVLFQACGGANPYAYEGQGYGYDQSDPDAGTELPDGATSPDAATPAPRGEAPMHTGGEDGGEGGAPEEGDGGR